MPVGCRLCWSAHLEASYIHFLTLVVPASSSLLKAMLITFSFDCHFNPLQHTLSRRSRKLDACGGLRISAQIACDTLSAPPTVIWMVVQPLLNTRNRQAFVSPQRSPAAWIGPQNEGRARAFFFFNWFLARINVFFFFDMKLKTSLIYDLESGKNSFWLICIYIFSYFAYFIFS